MEKIILGVDPGTRVMGYGIISVEGNHASLVLMDVLNMQKMESYELRIKYIFDSMIRLIDAYHPDYLAIEAPFYGKNVQSMLKLGRAQGVAIAAALSRQIPFCEYEPRRIKQSITGNGAASKEQVAAMLGRLLNFADMPKYLDATDALAVAYCHFLQKDIPEVSVVGKPRKPKAKSWASFLTENPDRVK